MNLCIKMCTILPWLVKIVWVWPQKIKNFNWNFQKEFVSFLPLHFCLVWFLEVRFPLIPFLLRFQDQNKSLHKPKLRPVLLLIRLKKVDSVEFFDLFWSTFRNWRDWKLKNVKWKIAISQATPKPNSDLNCGMVRAHFRLPLKRFSPT